MFANALEVVRKAESATAFAHSRIRTIEAQGPLVPTSSRVEDARAAIATAGERLTLARKAWEAARQVAPTAELMSLGGRLDETAARLESLSAALTAALTTFRARFESVAQTKTAGYGIGPGRRRPPPVPVQAVPDADGADLRPDPREAHTAAEFIAALRQYREWAGDITFRRMAQNAGNTVAPSTMCTALNGKILPKLDVVLAVVTGCGGTEEDRQRFATAWRKLRLSPKVTSSDSPPSPAARALRSVSKQDDRPRGKPTRLPPRTELEDQAAPPPA